MFITVFVTLERKGHTQNSQTMNYYLVTKEGHGTGNQSTKNISNEAQKVIRSNKMYKKEQETICI